METIETYYLIDYENVGSEGLSGCDKLKKTDHIIIFFTKNAKKIDMSDIADHGDAELSMIEVPAGKQSTDIHIGSYLGYLSGITEGKDTKIVIISRDTDFDNVIKFWKNKTGIQASRMQQIKGTAAKEKSASKKSETKKAKSKESESKKKETNAKKKAAKVSGEQKVKLNQEIMQILSKAGFEAEIPTSVASVVTKNAGEKDGKQQIYRAIISKYGQNKGLNIYNHIKKHV